MITMRASVQTLYKDVVERLSRSHTISAVSSKFSSLSSDAERVQYAFSILRDCDLLPDFSFCEERLKRQNICVDLRNKGNACFQQHKDNDAILLYTQSIANCPIPPEYLAPDISAQFSVEELELVTKKGSEDLAYAYANRSAVLFVLGEYKNCLKDIDQAEHLNYPDHLMYKLHLRKAKSLMKLGDGFVAERSCKDALNMLALASALTTQRREALELEIRTVADNIRNCEGKFTCEEPKQTCFDDLKLSFGQNVRIPCASDCVDIDHSEVMGRSVVAARDVSVGDVLLMEEPFAAMLLPHCFYTHCFNCFRRCRALIPCIRCSVVMFCGEACRKESWEKNHCFDCYLTTSMLSLEMRKLELLALRVVIAASKQHPSLTEFHHWVKSLDEHCGELGFNENGQYVSTDYRTVYHIVTNTEKRTVSDLFERSLIAGCILELLKTKTSFFNSVQDDESPDFIGGLILRHLQNLPCNAHEISEYSKSEQTGIYEQEETGAAAYATLSLVNHSCDPNVVRIIHGWKNALVAVRPIKKGEQVLDNYGYHYAVADLEERRASLEKQYFFTCHCKACEEHWPMYYHLPSKDPVFLCPNCHLRAVEQVGDTSTLSCPAHCGRAFDVGAMARELAASSEAALEAIETALKQPDQQVLNILTSHLKWLDRHVRRPWQPYNNCQEAIKHLWFCRSSLAS